MKSRALLTCLLLLLYHCGSSKSAPPPTGTPIPITTPDPSSGLINLAKYAKVSANAAAASDNFAADFAVDGIKPDPSNTTTFMWRPAVINSAILTLSWNSQVNISEVRIFDNPVKGQNIKKGKIEFFNDTNTSLAFPQTDFAALPDDGNTSLLVSGPSSPVTGMRIYLLDHTGDQAGIAEVVVNGTRVDEAIASGNVSPFCHVASYSSILSPLLTDTDTGAYRSAKIKDEVETGSEWVSNGNGAGAYIELECDIAYSITEVEIVDRTGCDSVGCGTMTRFKSGTITFEDISEKATFAKASVSDLSATLTPTAAKVTKKILLSFSDGDIVGGVNTGISELKVTGSYAP